MDSAEAVGSSSSTSRTSELDSELHLLNKCLSNALAVHLFVSRSLIVCGDGNGKVEQTLQSTLLDDNVQLYLKQLLHKYMSSTVMRRKLKSVKSLYFLQCLTDEKTRDEFVQVAAHPSFPENF
ncbi:uncharacterized protein TM35_000042700 [Trypanosoma theileri]|uniref:Uncharacterized protein n=1 Tax=Trypanosoma theileri TaxID=67003 RepID=A0A1X0P535_9TRYP|nr:uncharacterized protein TM35_000042700 [Trypanosoma theileri]ORC92056.1 hypothetical protein TM35_000042700 [Trypanosoma theileri]